MIFTQASRRVRVSEALPRRPQTGGIGATDYNTSEPDLILGVGYGFARGSTLNTSCRSKAAGQSGVEQRVRWVVTLG